MSAIQIVLVIFCSMVILSIPSILIIRIIQLTPKKNKEIDGEDGKE